MTARHLELLDQAEAAVLGGALASEPVCAQMVAQLDEPDFRRDAHRMLFRAVAACARQGRFGPVEVTSWLIDAPGDALGQVGGPVAVSGLHPPSPAVWGASLARMVQARRRRLLHEAATGLVDATKDWQLTDDDLRDRTTAMVAAVDVGSGAGRTVRLGQVRDQVDDVIAGRSSSRSVSTGWRTLDRHYRPAPGRWTLVGGIPGHGKSTFLDALVVQLADLHGWRTLICSPEKQPVAIHMAQLVQVRAGRPILGRPSTVTDEDVQAAAGWVDDHMGWLELDDEGRDVGSVLAMAKLEYARRPFQGLIIDPWNELDHTRDRALSETEHVSQSLTRIRSFARQHDVHVWVVAHPTKLTKNPVTGLYPVPTPYDVAGSANWRNKADNALAVWRDHSAPGDPSQVWVQKVRFQPEDGREGLVKLRFDPSCGRFVETSPV